MATSRSRPTISSRRTSQDQLEAPKLISEGGDSRMMVDLNCLSSHKKENIINFILILLKRLLKWWGNSISPPQMSDPLILVMIIALLGFLSLTSQRRVAPLPCPGELATARCQWAWSRCLHLQMMIILSTSKRKAGFSNPCFRKDQPPLPTVSNSRDRTSLQISKSSKCISHPSFKISNLVWFLKVMLTRTSPTLLLRALDLEFAGKLIRILVALDLTRSLEPGQAWDLLLSPMVMPYQFRKVEECLKEGSPYPAWATVRLLDLTFHCVIRDV